MSRYFLRQRNGQPYMRRAPFLADDFEFEDDEEREVIIRGGRSRGSRGNDGRPMSGAGYDIEEQAQKEEEHFARLEHAITLAVNYFQMHPVDYESRDIVRYLILSRAQANYESLGGQRDDEILSRLVQTWNRSQIDQCVKEEVKPVKMPSFSPIVTPNQTEDNNLSAITSAVIAAQADPGPTASPFPFPFNLHFMNEREASGGGGDSPPPPGPAADDDENEFENEMDDEFDFLNM